MIISKHTVYSCMWFALVVVQYIRCFDRFTLTRSFLCVDCCSSNCYYMYVLLQYSVGLLLSFSLPHQRLEKKCCVDAMASSRQLLRAQKWQGRAAYPARVVVVSLRRACRAGRAHLFSQEPIGRPFCVFSTCIVPVVIRFSHFLPQIPELRKFIWFMKM
jgi:hypothetical protein